MHTATTVTEAQVVFSPGAALMNDSICVTKTPNAITGLEG